MAEARLIIPVKPLAEGKSRLADVLDADGRLALNRGFLDHALTLADGFPGLGRTAVVSRDPEVLAASVEQGALAIAETGDGGLNDALDQALAAVDPDAQYDILVLPTDLPRANPQDLRAACVPPLALAPDARGAGTNALFMAAGIRIPFGFGPGSLAQHTNEARRIGIEPVMVRRPGLADDIDTPEDYRAWNDRVNG